MQPSSIFRLSAAATLLMAGMVQGQPPEASPRVLGERLAQLGAQQRIIVRVPSRRTGGAAGAAPTAQWRERDGPACLQTRDIAAANIGDRSIDFILRDNRRVRALLGRRCEGLNYYRGFYLDRPRDGRICAERDVIRSRMGGQCDIAEFRTLQPAPQARARRP